MELNLEEKVRGITVCLSLKIDAQALSHPYGASPACATSLLEQEPVLDESLDSAHTELLKLLRLARLEAERSLVSFFAQNLHESSNVQSKGLADR